ncbi:hypothetical protein HELRODRAFT_176661 [Helobdella robusta]|uniref:J domain-containing protein n=1 Tax=Helobdella robusta TaxID=6412 RepID=T1FAS0_HELRO|nr:hypothetical protein HELRODRAFT_176661 [Helobdella robusta]ESN99501.1 hypothetical protein HELRODRAFT_176661 [Helobdella robusta]
MFFAMIDVFNLNTTQQNNFLQYRNSAFTGLHKQKTKQLSDKSFKELLKAKETLCDAEKRLTYDNWRKSGLKIPFEVWKAMNENRMNISPMDAQASATCIWEGKCPAQRDGRTRQSDFFTGANNSKLFLIGQH